MGFDGATDPMVALSWLDDTEKILDEGMQCPDEDRVRIAGFLLGGNARKWWPYERTRKRHTWAQLKAAFHTEFCPPAFVETKSLEFETLTQSSMTVSEYERRFRELSDFFPNLVTDEVSKKRRFLDGLVETIALSLSGSDHPTYQSMSDAALEVERQTFIRQTRRRSHDGLSSGNPSQGSSKRGSLSSGTSGGRVMRIIAQRIRDAGASRRFIRNSILIMENLYSGGCETLETPNIFLFPSVLSFITILIWSCFILERFILQVKVEVTLFNLESVFF